MLYNPSDAQVVLNSLEDRLRIYRINGDVDLHFLGDFEKMLTNIKFVAFFVPVSFQIKNGTCGRHTLAGGGVVYFAKIRPDTSEEQLYKFTYAAFPEQYFPSLDPPIKDSLVTTRDPTLDVAIPPIDAEKFFGCADALPPRVDMDFGLVETPLVLSVERQYSLSYAFTPESLREMAKRDIIEAFSKELLTNFDRYITFEHVEGSLTTYESKVRVRGFLKVLPKPKI